MEMNPTLMTLALLAAAVLFIGLAARLVVTSPDAGINSWSRLFLVGLRLVIGWHFLVEGLEKLHSPTWSSETYLRESTGPLAPHFRALAGDRLVDRLTVGADDAFPPELEVEWRAYLDGVIEFYGLNEEYANRARGIFHQAKAKTLTWLTSATPTVQIEAVYPPPYSVEMTMAERLKRHEHLESLVRSLEADLPRYGKDLHKQYREVKTELARWRADMKRGLDQQFQSFKKDLRDSVLAARLRELVPAGYRDQLMPLDRKVNDRARAASTFGLFASPVGYGPLLALGCCDQRRFEMSQTVMSDVKEKEWLASVQAVHHQIRLRETSEESTKLDPAAETIFVHAFERKQGEQPSDAILPYMPRRPISAWTLLDWSDAVVKYGLVIVGGCLLLGFLTRTACLAGAGFLLMFFLAMLPLPGWPENPRAEGHYLYINKNVIEMFALLALATMRTGRWAGIDAWLQFLRPSRWRAEARADTVK